MPLVAYNEQQDTIKGIWPLHLGIFKVFKFIRFTTILFAVLFAIFFGLTFIENEILSYITNTVFYTYILLGLVAIILLGLFSMFVLYMGWLKPVKFDVWVYEICSKRLGTDIVFYTKNRLFIKYDIASAKEVDKKDFVTEMSDKSLYYSYFYIKTYPDEQLLEIEITPKQPIPNVAILDHKDDKNWNLIPLGLAINDKTLKVSAIPWTINDENVDAEMIQTVPSITICIVGGTGSGKSVLQNGIIGHFSRFSDKFQICGVI